MPPPTRCSSRSPVSPGVKDLTDDDVSGRSEMRLMLNREKLARTGVNPAEVARLLRLYGEGELVATTRDGGEKVEVVVRARQESLNDVTELLQRVVPLADGRSVQLGELVDHELRLSKGYIRHYQLTRAITVEAELDRSQIDTVEANDRLKAAWAQLQPRFPGVELDFSGELEDIQESLDAMGKLFVLGIGLIYLILATQFRSYWQPLIILLTVPLAFTGVVLGLLVSGNPLSLYTLYGVIALTGIAVNSAIGADRRRQRAPRGRHECAACGDLRRAPARGADPDHLDHDHRRAAVAGDRAGRQVADVGAGGGEHRVGAGVLDRADVVCGAAGVSDGDGARSI